MNHQTVFQEGTHTYSSQHGTVTIHVPRDVAVDEVLPALSELALKGEKRNAA